MKYLIFLIISLSLFLSCSNKQVETARINAEKYIIDSVKINDTLKIEGYEFIAFDKQLNPTTKDEVVAGVEFAEGQIKYHKSLLELEIRSQKMNIHNQSILDDEKKYVKEYIEQLEYYNTLLKNEVEVYEYHGGLAFYAKNENGNVNKYVASVTFKPDLSVFSVDLFPKP